jgi:hypothetical protein
MKKLLLLLLLISSQFVNAQRKVTPTEKFSISGKIKTELKFTLTDLNALETKAIPDIVITNNSGEVKSTAKGLKGILLKSILEKLEFQIEKPKELNEFYFTFVASDGYKAVFSWNEIFNTETGNNIYLITEKDGKKISEMEDRILIMTTSDFKTGRRHIRGLEKIVVSRVE